ncbi:MAG: AraC family ligand binding domain-containing protein [Lentisphaeria bacterium]|nr:MAG: AraC family ligand binding domain-containing protein [Lentisphaeria bacterium]
MEEERTIQSLRGDNLWKGGFPLRVVRYDHRRNRRMHQHDFFELVLVTSGHSRHVTPNGSCEISAGDIFLIRPGTAHAYEAVSDFSLVNLIYAPNLLPLCDLAKSPGYQALFVLEPEQWLPGGEFRHLRLDRETLHRAEIEIERLENTLSESKPGHQFRALAVFMGIVSMLADYFTELAVPPERQELFRLGQVLGYLEKNYSSPADAAGDRPPRGGLRSHPLPAVPQGNRRLPDQLPQPNPDPPCPRTAPEHPASGLGNRRRHRLHRQQLLFALLP